MLTALESPLKLSILSLINLERFKWSDMGGILNVLFIYLFITKTYIIGLSMSTGHLPGGIGVLWPSFQKN